MQDAVITLIGKTASVDEFGDQSLVPTERTIFAEERSIGQSEYYQAAAVGLRPEIKFVIADYLEYQNEQTIRYCPFGGKEEEYTVVRTYRKDETLEIVCRKGIEA